MGIISPSLPLIQFFRQPLLFCDLSTAATFVLVICRHYLVNLPAILSPQIPNKVNFAQSWRYSLHPTAILLNIKPAAAAF